MGHLLCCLRADSIPPSWLQLCHIRYLFRLSAGSCSSIAVEPLLRALGEESPRRPSSFGCRSSAGVFGAVADMLVAIYKAYNYGPLIKWVDNFLVIWLPHYTHSEDDFMNLTGQHGVP